MNIHSLSSTANAIGSSSSTASSSPADANSQLSPDSFIQLLTAQLKAQDPTNPLDPSQFVDQLVQFNTLQQVTQIRELIANGASVSGQTASGSAAQSTGNN